MAFDVGNGLSLMGGAVAKTAGDYLLANQKSELEDQSQRLSHSLAMERQTQQQGFQTDFEKTVKQPFEQSQTKAQLESEERRTHETAGATLGAAGTAAAAHVKAAQLELEGKKYQADVFGNTREAVANTQAEGRKAVEGIKQQNKKDLQAASTLSPESIETAAHVYLATGELPNLGFGGKAEKTLVMNRANELMTASGMTPQEFVENKATSKSANTALSNMNKQYASAKAFNDTADQTGQLVLQLAPKGVGPTGIPVFDKYVQAGRKATGDPDVVAFNAALESYKAERAKIISGSMGNQMPTDAAREHVDGMIDRASNMEQLQAAMKTLDAESGFRMNGYQTEMKKLTSAISGGGQGLARGYPGSTPAPGAPATGQQGDSGKSRPMPKPTVVDGKTYYNPMDFVPNVPYDTPQGPGFWHPDPKNPNGGTFTRQP